MPIDNTIALQVEQPDAMKSLGSMLNMGKQQLELQKARDLYSSDVAQRQAESRGAVANSNVEVQTQAPRINQSVQASNQANVGTSAAQFGLDKSYMGTALETAGGLMQDPRITAEGDKYNAKDAASAILESEKQMVLKGVPELQARMAAAPFYNAAGKSGAVKQMIANTIQGQQSAQGQAGQSLIPANSQQTPGSDTAGNPAIYSKNQFGNVQPMQSLPIQGQISAPMPSGPFAPGEKDRIPVLSQEVVSSRNTALNAPLLHTTNQGILREIDQVSATGHAGPAFQQINSLLGGVLDFSSAEKKASSYDMVGKYLERNALTAAAGMGPQTNAGLEAQIKANGSLGYNPTAIKKITKLNDALVSGTEAYNPGLQKALANNPQRGVLAKEQYDQQWSSVFKPEVMQLYNASKSGDTAELNELIKNAGGKNSAGAKDLILRAQGIQSLRKNGHL